MMRTTCVVFARRVTVSNMVTKLDFMMIVWSLADLKGKEEPRQEERYTNNHMCNKALVEYAQLTCSEFPDELSTLVKIFPARSGLNFKNMTVFNDIQKKKKKLRLRKQIEIGLCVIFVLFVLFVLMLVNMLYSAWTKVTDIDTVTDTHYDKRYDTVRDLIDSTVFSILVMMVYQCCCFQRYPQKTTGDIHAVLSVLVLAWAVYTAYLCFTTQGQLSLYVFVLSSVNVVVALFNIISNENITKTKIVFIVVALGVLCFVSLMKESSYCDADRSNHVVVIICQRFGLSSPNDSSVFQEVLTLLKDTVDHTSEEACDISLANETSPLRDFGYYESQYTRAVGDVLRLREILQNSKPTLLTENTQGLFGKYAIVNLNLAVLHNYLTWHEVWDISTTVNATEMTQCINSIKLKVDAKTIEKCLEPHLANFLVGIDKHLKKMVVAMRHYVNGCIPSQLEPQAHHDAKAFIDTMIADELEKTAMLRVETLNTNTQIALVEVLKSKASDKLFNLQNTYDKLHNFGYWEFMKAEGKALSAELQTLLLNDGRHFEKNCAEESDEVKQDLKETIEAMHLLPATQSFCKLRLMIPTPDNETNRKNVTNQFHDFLKKLESAISQSAKAKITEKKPQVKQVQLYKQQASDATSAVTGYSQVVTDNKKNAQTRINEMATNLINQRQERCKQYPRREAIETLRVSHRLT
jgi:hypothetical protein